MPKSVNYFCSGTNYINMNFLIKYKAFDKNNTIFSQGTIRVKNKETKFEAQCSFEDFLKRKHSSFRRLEISSCEEDMDVMSFFSNIFGWKK